MKLMKFLCLPISAMLQCVKWGSRYFFIFVFASFCFGYFIFHKIYVFIKVFFRKRRTNPQETFAEDVTNGKLCILLSSVVLRYDPSHRSNLKNVKETFQYTPLSFLFEKLKTLSQRHLSITTP